jgi:hypothetical protein
MARAAENALGVFVRKRKRVFGVFGDETNETNWSSPKDVIARLKASSSFSLFDSASFARRRFSSSSVSASSYPALCRATTLFTSACKGPGEVSVDGVVCLLKTFSPSSCARSR